nr:dTDP-4-dehydrorhamnose reductase [uncultured Kingella sp.]
MTTYLITGANGQVGSQLVQQLQAQPNTTVIATDRNTLDITDRAAVFQAAQTHRPDIIINAAAHTAVDKAESEPDFARAINVDGTRHLAEAAQDIGVAFLHISTDYVFDGKGETPYRESDATAPQSVYGQTKLDGETAALTACPRTIILRTAWVFGEHGNNFVKTMLRLGRERDTLGIVADQFGSPTYAGDIAAALIQIAQHIAAEQPTEYGVYHFSGSPYTSWYGFASEIFRRAAAQNLLPRAPALNAIATSDYPTPAKRPANSRLDCSKIQAAFGIAPSDWQAALGSLKDYVG